MRILITNKGETTIKELEEMTEKNKYKTTTARNRFRKRNLSINTDNSFLEKSKKQQQEFYRTFRPNAKFIDIEKRALTKEEIRANVVPIKIKIKKLTFPKHIADQYDSEANDNRSARKSIIMEGTNLPCITIPKENLNDDKGSRLSIGQILPSSTVYHIKKKLFSERKMMNKLSKIDETKFRSSYQKNTELERLNQILKYKKIPFSKMNLINYLNKKENISNSSIRRLITLTDAEISKTNKVCQIVFHNQVQNEVLKEIIKAKIIHNHIHEKITFETDIQEMKKEIDSFKNTIHKYENRVSKMEKYREAHTDIIKYHWNKYNFEALNKKKTIVNGKVVPNHQLLIEDI